MQKTAREENKNAAREVTVENLCRVHTKNQVIIKMNKFNMFITAVYDGPRTKVFTVPLVELI